MAGELPLLIIYIFNNGGLLSLLFTKAHIVHIFCGASLLSALYAAVRFSHVAELQSGTRQYVSRYFRTAVEVLSGDQVSCSYLGGCTIPAECIKLSHYRGWNRDS